MDCEYMYNIDGEEAEMRYNLDNTCTVSIEGKEIHTFMDADRACKYLRRNGFKF